VRSDGKNKETNEAAVVFAFLLPSFGSTYKFDKESGIFQYRYSTWSVVWKTYRYFEQR
jgi:hypothetical protein